MEIIQTVPFDFDEIYADIEQKFQDKGYDAIYEGSDTAQLITAMSYLTSMLNVNTAVNVNETILTLANKRDNVLTDARMLGYEIQHTTSYVYTLEIRFIGNGVHTIPKYTKFTSGTKEYYFLDNDVTVTVENDVPEVVTINVKEGLLKTFQTDPDLLLSNIGLIEEDGETIVQYYVDVPIEKVESNGLEVFLTYYDDEALLHENEPWAKSEQFMIDKDSKIDREYVRLDDITYKTPRLYFKLAGVGEGLREGTIVEINALISAGPDGAMLDVPTTTTLPTGEILSKTLVTQGAEEEKVESIKSNAPLFHNSANRAVTKSDYKAICVRQTAVDEAEVWGGDDEYPKAPGHVWFSFTPQTLDRFFESTDEFNIEYNLQNPEDVENWFIEPEEIQSTSYDSNGDLLNPGVWDVLEEYKIPTLIYHHRNPMYVDFSFDINIMKYHIQTSKADIHDSIFEVIRDYFDISDDADDGYNERLLNMEAFEREYFHSNVEKRIDSDLTDITGFNNILTTRVMVTSRNVVVENEDNLANNEIIIPLSTPYETYFVDGNLDKSKLPSIDTPNFIFEDDLLVDWSGLAGNEEIEARISVPIKLGYDTVGEYLIHNNSRKDIEVILYVKDTDGDAVADGVYDASSITKAHFNTAKYVDLKYYSPNFAIIKNCIARLNTVKFS